MAVVKRKFAFITMWTAMLVSGIMGFLALLLLFTQDGQMTGVIMGFFCWGIAAFAKNIAHEIERGDFD